MNFGYIRVSRDEQNFDLQTDALEKAGCEKIYKEKVSGAAKFRPEFDKLLGQFYLFPRGLLALR